MWGKTEGAIAPQDTQSCEHPVMIVTFLLTHVFPLKHLTFPS